ncbi:hypothetical protein LTR78_000201 [Recurvomyces mirabilis]|uniref:PEBP-like protein n=1 Tax=Recurvomyces mirabilis TaxID=574656 RepID=A0AAE0WY31_9PEZI|nr:hypothetical protein LTR78_000201 [Recurvomyces mirabilis]KAK5161858.1 hypothetical protein LTS14_000203 [Recurvomyces mirabilis]
MYTPSWTAACALALSTLASAQTPPGSSPSASQNLAVSYNGTQVTPNVLLPQPLVATQPSVTYSSALNGTYMLALLDLSISASSYNASGPKAPGLEPCRTTRLHWLQGNVTRASNGSLVAGSAPIAMYAGPMPPLNDIPHTYTFYLLRQPANFTLPAWDAGRDLLNASASARMNFSIQAIANQVGAPVAANYMRVQNAKNNATGTASNGTCPSNSTTGNAGTPAPYTGVAATMGANAALVLVAVLAFALL